MNISKSFMLTKLARSFTKKTSVFLGILALVMLGLGGNVFAKPDSRVVAAASGGWTIAGIRVIAFNARERANGTFDGQWQRMNHVPGGPATPNHGEVLCVSFNGNQAWIGTIATTGPFAGFEGGFRVIDNGQGSNAPRDEVSLHVVNFGIGGAEIYCNDQPEFPGLLQEGAGNISIR